MANNLYTTKTAALKATKADICNLNSKTIKVNGKDVVTSVKHPNDTREVITENDLWGSWAEIKDGEITFHNDEIVNPNFSEGWATAWNASITKVEDNKAYIGDELYANIQTEIIKDGRSFFYMDYALTSFVGDLNNIEIGGGSAVGDGMFADCSLTTFTNNLGSLRNGGHMFHLCSKLTTFTSDLSSLTNGIYMFYDCSNLTTFTSQLSSLTNGESMFGNCSELRTFTSDLSSLTNGSSMFSYCSNLIKFTSDLSSLIVLNSIPLLSI